MSLTLEIAGVDRTANWWYPGLSIGDGAKFARRAGGQSPATFVLYDTVGSGGYRPTTGQSVTLKSSGTPIFAGLITDVDEGGLGDRDRGVRTTITVVDNMALPSRVYYTVTYAAGAVTLKQILQDLVAGPLSSVGVTLNPAQATGSASFTALVYTDASVQDILNQLQNLTGWVWRIDASKVLTMISPGGESSGLTLSDSAGQVQGSVSLRKSRSTSYANTVTGIFGPSGIYAGARVESVVGNGTQTVWTFDVADGVPYTDAGGGGTIYVNGVIKNSAVGEFTWTLNPTYSLATLTLAVAPGLGQVVTFKRNINYPFTVLRQDTTLTSVEGPWPARYINTDITDVDTGVAMTVALLARDKTEPWIVTVRTLAGLAWPGQTVALTFSERQVSGTYMVLSADFQTTEDGQIETTIVCLSGSALQADWLDYFKAITGGSSGATSSLSGGLVSLTSTTLSAPFYLGGSRDRSLAPSPAAWTPVVDFVRFVSPGAFTARVRAELWARHGSVSATVRLYDETAGAVVSGMTSGAVTSTTAVAAVLTGNLIAGHSYRLEVLAGTSGEGVFALGTLEAV